MEVGCRQARNEELARKAAKASEEDIKQLTEEYETRLGTAERKVYALTKERDALRRGNEKLTSATDLLKEKDNIIAQVTLPALLHSLAHCSDCAWSVLRSCEGVGLHSPPGLPMRVLL